MLQWCARSPTVRAQGQGFFASARAKWASSSGLPFVCLLYVIQELAANQQLQEPAGSDPLYKRFTRGPVLGADAKVAGQPCRCCCRLWVARSRKAFGDGTQRQVSLHLRSQSGRQKETEREREPKQLQTYVGTGRWPGVLPALSP